MHMKCNIPSMNLARSVVLRRSESPHTIVRGSVSSFDVEDEVLDECDLVLTRDYLKTTRRHLDQEQ